MNRSRIALFPATCRLVAIAAVALPVPWPLSAQPAGPAAGMFPTAPFDPVAPVVKQQALEWVRAHAQPFDGELEWPAQLLPFLERLAGARVIGLGELSHGDRESTRTRLAIARGLIESQGVRLIGIEAPIGSGVWLDRFVRQSATPMPATDEHAAAERVLSQSGVYDIWRSEEFRDFLVWVRRFNQSAERPVRFANFDVSEPASDARLLIELIRDRLRHRARPELAAELAEVEAGLAPLLSIGSADAYEAYLPNQDLRSIEAHAALVERLARLLELGHADATDSDETPAAQRVVAALRDFYAKTARQRAGRAIEDTFKEAFAGNTNSNSIRNSVTRRDRFMADTIVRILEAQRSERMIVLAHNAHIERNGFDGLDYASYALSMGRFLQAELADAYVAVNFVTAEGSFTASLSTDAAGTMKRGETIGTIADNPFSLGAFYRQVGQRRFWIDLRALPGMAPWAVAWRSYPFVTLAPGNTDTPHLRYFPTTVPVAHGADISVFFDRVSAARRFPPRP